MADRKPVTFRASGDVRERVSAYQDQQGFKDASEAWLALVEIGLREQRYPVLYRLKGEVISWAGNLGVMAVLVVLAGRLTPLLSLGNAVVLSASLLAVAVAMLGLFELARVTVGANTLGDYVRRIVGWDV